ncbi:Box C/D snoRNA protein 1 [Sarcoptes scabiei]|uniref:Box C/D snoRNA protein 1 n=1 Tax=Sarcoptes scabiei TaxID=52283 RepID=A0A834R389_SARSC|nr:Box C/D snoRNA protein 1 [Sarcoptes scabiei]
MDIENNFFGLFGSNVSKTQTPIPNEKISKIELKSIEERSPKIFDNLDGMEDHAILMNRFVEENQFKQQNLLQSICSQCSKKPSVYTCPRCCCKTCSLKCSNEHKINFKCSGKRDQTGFIPLNHYSETHLSSDCKFLDRALEQMQNCKRILRNNPFQEHSNWTIRFIQEAQKRRIVYKKMPLAFKKARSNRSIYLYREKAIHWDIEFIFPNCLDTRSENQFIEADPNKFKTIRIKRNRISENLQLSTIINEMISTKEWLKQLDDDDESVIDLESNEFDSMKLYRESPNNIIALLQPHSANVSFSKMNLDQSLRKNLFDKTIIEYPTIIVVIEKFLTNYPLDV